MRMDHEDQNLDRVLVVVADTIKNYSKNLKYNGFNRPFVLFKAVFKKDINDKDVCKNSSTFGSIFQTSDPSVK